MGFQENFSRDEKEDLNYDDNAFYYYAMTMLFLALVPATYYGVIRAITQGEKVINLSIKNC